MKAYVTAHHLYNSGSLYGAWISLPIDEDGRAAIERIKDADRKAGGDAEMLIADTDGPNGALFAIGDKLYAVTGRTGRLLQVL